MAPGLRVLFRGNRGGLVMGRPKLDDAKRRDTYVTVSMTKKEKDDLREAAFKQGYDSVSDFVRSMAKMCLQRA